MNQSIRKLIHYSTISTLVWPKGSTFRSTISKSEEILQKFQFFSNIYLKISNFPILTSSHTNPKKFPKNAIIYFGSNQIIRKIAFDPKGSIGKGDENHENFWRKSTVICWGIEDNEHFIIIFHMPWKRKKSVRKILHIAPKNEGKMTFSQFY